MTGPGRKGRQTASKREQEIAARRESDVVARVVGRDDIDYSSDELPAAPRQVTVLPETKIRTPCPACGGTGFAE